MKRSRLPFFGGSPLADDTATAARKYWLSGSVQGVGYRFFALHEARSLGLVGYVKNLPDGRVEVYAIGGPRALAAFKKRLAEGPGSARVTRVDEINEPASERYTSFDIEY